MSKISKNKDNYPNFTLDSYKQTNKIAKEIKSKLKLNIDPINQNYDKYKPKNSKSNNLSQEYHKKMSEKKEKIRIKRIPQKDNLGKNLEILSTEYDKDHVKFLKKHKNEQSTEKPHKKLIRTFKEKNLNNFYYDNFNSKKMNKNDIIRVNVRIN
jgi:hypothetical protein